MDFNVGDTVVHWSFGLGKIIGLEDRVLSDQKSAYYLVQIRDFTVSVPVDNKTESRLRPPTQSGEFKKLFTILKGSGDPLVEDRLERKSLLRKRLADGKADGIAKVIRDLATLSYKKPLNDDDKNIMYRAQSLLCAEWGFSFSVPVEQAESELRHLLEKPAEIQTE